MKTYRELHFYGEPDRLERFLQEVQTYAHAPWTSGVNKRYTGNNWIYFDYAGSEAEKASVCIPCKIDAGKHALRVSNIVPLEKTELTTDEYNTVLEKFYEDIILPYKEDHQDIEIPEPSGDRFDPLSMISAAALKKLEIFSSAANKSTGASHPCDQERWFDFVCQTVDDGQMFDAATLSEFLQDEDYWGKREDGFVGAFGLFAWDQERAEKLASEYEQDCLILEYYKAKHGI